MRCAVTAVCACFHAVPRVGVGGNGVEISIVVIPYVLLHSHTLSNSQSISLRPLEMYTSITVFAVSNLADTILPDLRARVQITWKTKLRYLDYWRRLEDSRQRRPSDQDAMF